MRGHPAYPVLRKNIGMSCEIAMVCLVYKDIYKTGYIAPCEDALSRIHTKTGYADIGKAVSPRNGGMRTSAVPHLVGVSRQIACTREQIALFTRCHGTIAKVGKPSLIIDYSGRRIGRELSQRLFENVLFS